MGVLHTGCRAPQFRPPHLTPLPPLLSLMGEERGRMVGVFHAGCRAPQFRPPPGLPPLGGGDEGVLPLGGGDEGVLPLGGGGEGLFPPPAGAG
jgi:hypothetical protein